MTSVRHGDQDEAVEPDASTEVSEQTVDTDTDTLAVMADAPVGAATDPDPEATADTGVIAGGDAETDAAQTDGDGELLTKRQQRLRRRAERTLARREKRAARSPLNRGIRRGVLVGVLAIGALVGYSFVSSLLKTNNDPVAIKAVGWFRDHNLGFIANTAEKWFYTLNPPEKGGKLKGGIPTAAPVAGSTVPTPTTTTFLKPVDVKPFVATPEPGEGVWQPTGKIVDGHPVVYQTFIRPDAEHTSKLVGLAWMNSKLMSAALYNGTEEPGGRDWVRGSKVEESDYGPLLATFNSGFKINGSLGGYYTEGQTVRDLVDGRASIIIKTDGSITIGEWGRDAVMGPDIASVRQNLSLLIDQGVPAPDLSSNFQSRWGATLGNSLYVWRSGVGIDKNGGLIYAGGPAMSVQTLADVLQAAGAYNAMELDINTVWVSMHTYTGGENGTPIESYKLLDEMQRPPNRHLVSGSRDFIALFAKPTPVVATTTVPPTTAASTTTTKKR